MVIHTMCKHEITALQVKNFFRVVAALLGILFLLAFWFGKTPSTRLVEAEGCKCTISPTPTPTKAILATPTPKAKVVKKDTRGGEIYNYLNHYNSPMKNYYSTFVVQADKYGVNPKLLVALAVVESSAGKNNCGKNNAFSIMQWDKKGKRSCRNFQSYDHAIAYTAWLMGEYKKGGKVTVEQIGARYNPNSKKWIVDIKSVMGKI